SKRGELQLGDALSRCVLEQSRPASLAEIKRLGEALQRPPGLRREDAFRLGESERLADVDHRFRGRQVADLGGTVHDGDFVVVLERAVAERLENLADA